MMKHSIAVSIALAAVVAVTTWAQMPGMDSPGKRTEPSAAKPAETAAATIRAEKHTDNEVEFQEMPGLIIRFWQRYMGEQSPYRGLILVILTLVVLLNLKAYLTRTMRRKLKEQAFLQENADSFLKVWHGLWKFVIAVLVLMAMSGSLKLLGLTAGFFGMMLGWSLQQPVTADIIEKTGEQPFIRCEFLDWGVLVRLRYNTVPTRRQEISTRIIEILLREFGKEFPRVRFAIPAQSIRHRPDAGAASSAMSDIS